MTEGILKYTLYFQEVPAAPFPGFEALEAVRTRLRAIKMIGVNRDGYGVGNLSLRTEKGFRITGTQTGHLERLGPEHYPLVTGWDEKTFTLRGEGAWKPSSEGITHGTVYGLSRSIGAVLHVHHTALWRFMLENGFPKTTAPYGSLEQSEETRALYQGKDPFAAPAYAMEGHEDGVVVFGKTLEEAEAALSALAALLP